MPRGKVNDEALMKLANVYNCEGRAAAKKMLETQYGVKNPYPVIRRMKETPALGYDQETGRFNPAEIPMPEPDGIFMSMEELCTRPSSANSTGETEPVVAETDRSAAMEKLIHDLIGEKLLELSRYVTISQLSKTIIVDRNSLESDGYTLAIR